MNGLGWYWLIAAAVLAATELALPGVFLIFVAIAAAITGLIALAVPMGLTGELVSLTVWTAVAVLVGKRWYVDFPVATSDPDLNNRAARMIGQTVRVTDAIIDGHGRVRVGDGEWPATGPDQPAGAQVRIAAVEGGVVRIASLAD